MVRKRSTGAGVESTTARGRRGESLAAAWLESQGYIILARNLRVGRDEIDILALDGETMVAVEVRAHRRSAMVHPLESLTATKRARLRRSAVRHAMDRNQQSVRIDVVTVTDGEIDHIPNAVDFSER